MATLIYEIKNFCVDIISVLAYLLILLKRQFGFSKRRICARILIYHSVSFDNSLPIKIKEVNVHPKLFKAHMDYLKRNSYDIISISEFYKRYINSRDFKKDAVVITFDDGHENVFMNAYPVIKELAIPAALFVTYQFIEKGEIFPWMGNSELGRPLNWAQVNLMKDCFEVQSHSLSHRNLRELDDEDLKRECFDSRRLIAEELGENVDFFAYPRGSFGSFDARTDKFLKEAGYKLAFLNISGSVSKDSGSFDIKRTRIIDRDTLWRFKLKLAGAYDWLDSVKGVFVGKC